MSVERDELARLVREIPDDEVPGALAELRRHVRSAGERSWPAAWFGIAPGDGSAAGARSEELLAGRFRQVRVLVCDTGPLVVAALSKDPDHRACVDLFTATHLAGRAIVLPGLVVAEVCYLLARQAGAKAEALFLQSMGDGPLGATDAAVITLAERLDVREVATLDRRHFSVVRPRHAPAFDASAVGNPWSGDENRTRTVSLESDFAPISI